MEIGEEGDSIQLVVRDDGRGFDPEAPSSGFGIVGIHERVALLGGELGMTSSPALRDDDPREATGPPPQRQGSQHRRPRRGLTLPGRGIRRSGLVAR